MPQTKSSGFEGEPAWIRFATGALGSCTAEFVTLPIDFAKVRMQLQTDNPVYRNLFHCIYKAGKEEGVRSLYNGLQPALLRQLSYSGIRMMIYEPIRDVISRGKPEKDIKFWERTMAGGTAGAIGIMCANPTELIKVRMQGDKTRTRYPGGVIDAFRQTYAKEGIRGLWTGVGPNMLRAYIVNAAELASYDQSKSVLVNNFAMSPDSKATHLTSSVIAGGIAAVFSQPVDLIKNRYMNQVVVPGQAPKYSSILDCVKKTVKAEGVSGLFKGLSANAARIGTWCVVMFMTYEQYRIAMRPLYQTDNKPEKNNE